MPIGVRERLAKYVKYKASLFYFYFFPPTLLLKQLGHGISREMAQNTHCDVRKCLFGVHTTADNFGVQIPPKTVKNGLL